MLQVDGFHGVFLSLYTEPSHFWIPPRQQLAHSLSVANGFLIESPQVVYLFVEVKLELCGQDSDLHHAVFFFLFFFSFWQWTAGKHCPQSISAILCVCLVSPHCFTSSTLWCHAVQLCKKWKKFIITTDTSVQCFDSKWHNTVFRTLCCNST